ncbi:molybdopterin-dependent oxidoreductase [Ideonella azotifigens]|uniref:Molybdopterin-dependent oxidoreductase n=1 Tax=Ideonella azotifigens TaxID=513160 RepID=A0ABP3V2U8_9BURK|nr:molybdopterin-dependent oxidoreductase [Ideonella azotifigens]MCD2340846.1 molybdopterin-dependent oxidoreductase [Ideonella azotifigens]
MNHTPVQAADGTTTHYRICPLCEACCGLDVQVQDGKVIRIRGAEHDVFSAGFICPKGYALKDLHEDPDRLRQPMIKRNGQHVAVSWDEAFAEAERLLKPVIAQHGRDAVALSVGNPSAHKIGLLLYFAKFARVLGSRNIFSASTLDQMPKQLQSGLMFGHWLSVAVPDIERCDYLLVLGANPMASNGSMWTVPDFRGKAKALRARGGKLVVIDPRRGETAAVADAHHFIRPGGDAFLLAGMLHTVLAEGLEKPGRLAPMLKGLDDVRHAVATFSPEAVATRCGVPAETIRQLAREFANTPRACIYGRIGTCTQRYGTVASWLIDTLNAVTGHLDSEGGAMFPQAAAFAANTQGKPGQGRGVTRGRHASRVSGAPEVYGELPMTLLAEEIETPGDGQVRALISVASNPVLSSPGGPRLAQALQKLDCMISLDIYLNETTQHAHVILPGLSPLEEAHYDVAFPQLSFRNHARHSAPVFAPPADHSPEWQTLLRLAAMVAPEGKLPADPLLADDALLLDDLNRSAGPQAQALMAALSADGLRGPERQLELALRSGPYGDQFGRKPEGLTLAKVKAANGGIDLGPLQPRLPELLRTPSGKVELAPALCLADLAEAAKELVPATSAASKDELLLIGRRELRSNNSWMHNLPTLAKGPMRCTALVHPQDAQRLGLSDGGRAELSRGGQSIEVPVVLSDEMMPGVISLPHGWGHDQPGTKLGLAAQRPGANLNAVLDDTLRDPLSGNAVLSGVAVKVRALQPAEVT